MLVNWCRLSLNSLGTWLKSNTIKQSVCARPKKKKKNFSIIKAHKNQLEGKNSIDKWDVHYIHIQKIICKRIFEFEKVKQINTTIIQFFSLYQFYYLSKKL